MDSLCNIYIVQFTFCILHSASDLILENASGPVTRKKRHKQQQTVVALNKSHATKLSNKAEQLCRVAGSVFSATLYILHDQ